MRRPTPTPTPPRTTTKCISAQRRGPSLQSMQRHSDIPSLQRHTSAVVAVNEAAPRIRARSGSMPDVASEGKAAS